MCLVLLAYRTHPHYPLILAANRDEYYARPPLLRLRFGTTTRPFWPAAICRTWGPGWASTGGD